MNKKHGPFVIWKDLFAIKKNVNQAILCPAFDVDSESKDLFNYSK